MSEQPNQQVSQLAQVFTRIASVTILGVGIVALVGWSFHWRDLAALFPGLPAMKANTALGFMLAGISLWLNGRVTRGPAIARWAGTTLALGVFAIGAVTLAEFVFQKLPVFDEWLARDPEGGPFPGRMSYLTAINFLLMGLGLLLLDGRIKRGPHPGQFFTLSAILICLLAVVGYIVHLGIFYGESSLFPGTRMPGFTTGCFLLLGTGILCARPHEGLMRVLTSRTDGGFILRRLILVPVAVPLTVTVIPIFLRHFHLTNLEIGSWLFSFGNIFVFTIIFWWSAALLYRHDIKRQVAEDRLKAFNSELEKRVEERSGQVLRTNRELQAEVAERRHAEEEVRKLNASLEERVRDRTAQINTAYKELETFSYSVSHDLRAPLRAIENYSAMLLEENPQLPEQSQIYIQSAQRNVEKMQRLIDDLLAFSRVSHHQLQKQPVALDEVARQCFTDLQLEAKGREIKLAVQANLRCHADPALLRQLLLNLLSNAIKFTRRQDVAIIEVGSLPAAEARNGPIFFVRDNGAGFDMASVAKLFGVFQRLHQESEYEGTGLGLAIVQNIVSRHGGRIWAESAPEKGATFFFTLPD